MATTSCEKRTVSLPREQSQFIDRLVDSGAYASASEVVRAGLRALEERDAAVERWLRTEVVEAYDELDANPGSGIPAEEVFEQLRAHIAGRIANRQ
jgi:antitoxin ParD1/3/4